MRIIASLDFISTFQSISHITLFVDVYVTLSDARRFCLSIGGSSRGSITFEVDAWPWANQRLVFYKGLSENQDRAAGREGQIL